MSLYPSARIFWVALATAAPWAPAAQGSVPIVPETVWNLEIDLVTVGPGTTGTLGTSTMVASRDTPGIVEIPLGAAGGWPAGLLRLRAAIDRLLPGEATVEFAADLTRAGRPTVTATRTFPLREGGSQILEIFGEGDRRLLLSIRGEEGTRPVLRRVASAGAPILLRVEIERVEGERSVPLETNDLNTFVGEPVEYAFDFGGDSQRLRLVLTPLSIAGSLAQIRAQVSGQLPGASGPVLLSRDQLLAASRGATSSLEVVAGDPPQGYRFRVTPEF